MFKTTTQSIVGLLFSINCFSTANSVYHEFTMNTVGGGCGIFVSNPTPTNADAVTIEFTIDYQLFTNQARIYYTTDGSVPAASFGVPSGTTQVITAAYFCSYNNGSGIVDVARGTIPALPVGTVVKYIVSAWHSSGGLEIFATGGTNTSSSAATIFTYTVGSVLPITILGFSAKKEMETVKLTWSTSQEINTSHYEIYSSDNGIHFKNIGIKKASGNLNIATQYNFTDTHPVNGNNFYKIKIIDNDGRFSYTKIITLAFNKNSAISINVSGRILHIRLNPSQKNYMVALINNLGQRLTSWSISNNSTSAEYDLNLPQNLKGNIYYISIKGNAGLISKSIFIQ